MDKIMKTRIFLSLCLLLSCCFSTLVAANAKEVVILDNGKQSIRGMLPDTWRKLSDEEIGVYLQQKENLLQSAGQLLSVFQRQKDSSGVAPVLFVFHSAADKRISEEQREKMYAWFEKNREVVQQVTSTSIKNMLLENIEYLHERDTIIFESKIASKDRQMYGVSGIIFLKKGYLNIVGYEFDGENRFRKDFFSFIKSLTIPREFQYSSVSRVSSDLAWLINNWQQFAGIFLFLLVYGLVFLRKKG